MMFSNHYYLFTIVFNSVLLLYCIVFYSFSIIYCRIPYLLHYLYLLQLLSLARSKLAPFLLYSFLFCTTFVCKTTIRFRTNELSKQTIDLLNLGFRIPYIWFRSHIPTYLVFNLVSYRPSCFVFVFLLRHVFSF